MPNIRLTTEEFIQKSRAVHGEKYDYSATVYSVQSAPVQVICPEHGEFRIRAGAHLQGAGCTPCGKRVKAEKKRIKFPDFLARAREVHGDLYDYDESSWTKITSKVRVICRVHGPWMADGTNHLKGQGCKACFHDSLRWTTDKFIERAREIHGDTYDYSLTQYKGQTEKVVVICKVHGPVEMYPSWHTYHKGGCARCNFDSVRRTIPELIDDFRAVHGDTYIYDRIVEYKNSQDIVTVVCKQHGAFDVVARIHQSGSGCPVCCESLGERVIRSALEVAGVEFEKEFRAPGCTHKGQLRFDFKVDRLLIEFHGKQHYEDIPFFDKDGRDPFEERQLRDSIKAQWAKDNGYDLVCIPYTQLSNAAEIALHEVNVRKHETTNKVGSSLAC